MKLSKLIKEETAKNIYYSKNENLDALIKADEDGLYIYKAGTGWKNFNYKKGLNALIKVDTLGTYIYNAGIEWKSFDFNKGFKVLKNTKYYKQALEDWPKDIKQSEERSKEIRKSAKKLPKKKLKL